MREKLKRLFLCTFVKSHRRCILSKKKVFYAAVSFISFQAYSFDEPNAMESTFTNDNPYQFVDEKTLTENLQKIDPLENVRMLGFGLKNN